jgi:hypothetical protein
MQRDLEIQEGKDDRDTRLTLALAWSFVLFNYVYADIGMFAKVIASESLLARFQELGSTFTDLFMLAAAAVMEIPIAMVLLSWVLAQRAARWANIASGIVMTLVILGTLFGAGKVPPINFYTFFQVIEIAATAGISLYAWRWRTPSKAASGRVPAAGSAAFGGAV